jgi:GDP/UDP-N,N'-diacetylbacillosamine 2-epimerase (hydrolysing)
MNKGKKIAVFSSTRADYGLLKWILFEIHKSDQLNLQLIVSGTHLSEAFGNTLKEIKEDGFSIDSIIDNSIEGTEDWQLAKASSGILKDLPLALKELNPDLLLILGDRYELLSVCQAAQIMRIPIAHLSGGDITEGVIDDNIRHAITKLSSLHFPGTKESAKRIIQMGEESVRVHTVGEPGLDALRRIELTGRNLLVEQLELDTDKEWVLLTYHPESWISTEDNLDVVQRILNRIPDSHQIIATAAGADTGSAEINDLLETKSVEKSNLVFYHHLGQRNYLSLMKECAFMIGNSSSGIVESPSFNIPSVLVGERQKGRIEARNTKTVGKDEKSIIEGINWALNYNSEGTVENPYGDGNASKKIVEILETTDFSKLLKKNFFEIGSTHRVRF